MIDKLIYIGCVSLSDKLKEDFFFKEVKEKKIHIEYWDLSEIIFKNANFYEADDLDLICFDSYIKLKLYIKKLDLNKTFFVSTISYNYRTIYLYFLLKKFNCKVSFFSRGSLPRRTYTNKGVLYKIININLLLNYVSFIIKNNIALLLKKIDLVKTYDVIYYAGIKSLENFCVGFRKDLLGAKLYKLNYFDFDKTLKIKYSEKLLKNKYCVFHDEYLPYHPDFKINNKKTIK